MKTKIITLATLCLCLTVQIEAQDKNKMMQALMGSKNLDASKLPDTYAFEWEYKTVVKTAKNETIDMNFLIGSNKECFGMEMSSKEYRQMGNVCMVMDARAGISTMFMSANGQNLAQLTKMPDLNDLKNKEPEFSIKEIGSKIILGFESYGMEIENADHKATLYFTLDAPINFSAFFAFSNNKSSPKGFDPALLKVLAEDALLMEMDMVNKKKSKESFTMTAISLEEKKTEFHKKDYQFMNMGF